MLIVDSGDEDRGMAEKDFRGLKREVVVCELVQKCHFFLPPRFMDLGAEAVLQMLQEKGLRGLCPWWVDGWLTQAEPQESQHKSCCHWTADLSQHLLLQTKRPEPPEPLFSSFPSSSTNLVDPETIPETHRWGISSFANHTWFQRSEVNPLAEDFTDSR